MARKEPTSVYVREKPGNADSIWEINRNKITLKDSKHKIEYKFKNCFTRDSKNHEIHRVAAKGIIGAVLSGLNGTVLTYGQTGSGKTYTMMGTSREKGLIQLGLEDLFSVRCEVECSYLQIYNEHVFDLLGERSYEALSVYEGVQKGFHIRGLGKYRTESLEDSAQLIEKGEKNRVYASTTMNLHSSRSHTIFRVTVDGSVLNFVDLAGSERLYNGEKGKSMNEGKCINKSLFYLCQVISRLSERKEDSHVPYRNSLLTKILRTSLGGNSVTSVVCTVMTTAEQYEMTLSTLRFGGRAKKVVSTVEKARKPCGFISKTIIEVPWVADIKLSDIGISSKCYLKFDSAGLFAHERIDMIVEEIENINRNIMLVNADNTSVSSENAQIIKELEGILTECEEISEKTNDRDSKYEKLCKTDSLMNAKLSRLESFDYLLGIPTDSLIHFEHFYSTALDRIKDEKYKRLCSTHSFNSSF